MLKGKVLLVEDNEVNQLVAGAMLEHWQVEYVIAANGQEAVEKWREHKPDLILMDCQMPVMDGYEATRTIRTQEKKPQRIPIIALTANGTQGDREKCFSAGMDDYLTKPFKEDDMHSMLGKWLGKATMQGNTTKEVREMDPTVSYMNKVVLRNLQQFLNEDKLHALLSRYILDSASIIQQLDGALASSNQDEARRMVHSLKSTSANVGAMPLSELAKELEDLARAGQLDAMSTRTAALKDCFAQTQTSIDAMEIMRKRQTG